MIKWIVVKKIQPSICLDDWGKPRKKPQSGWSAPGFEPGTSRILLVFFFYSLLFRDASTSLVISRLGSLGVYQKAVYSCCCVANVHLLKFTDFNFYDIWIWWIMVKRIVVMKIQPSICLDDWGKPRKTPVRLVGTGIRTRDLPNASLVRYHGATSLGRMDLSRGVLPENTTGSW